MKAVVFDMDGLLFDTERLCEQCWKEIGEPQGYVDIGMVFHDCVGTTTEYTCEVVKKRYGADFDFTTFRKATNDLRKRYMDERGVPVKKGAYELLPFLKANGFKLAVASSSFHDVVSRLLTSTNLRQYFDEIIGGEMVKHSKPSPDIYLAACEKLNIPPGDAYAVEDSYNGIRAAHTAGMKPIMVPDIVEPNAEIAALTFAICEDLGKVKNLFK